MLKARSHLQMMSGLKAIRCTHSLLSQHITLSKTRMALINCSILWLDLNIYLGCTQVTVLPIPYLTFILVWALHTEWVPNCLLFAIQHCLQLGAITMDNASSNGTAMNMLQQLLADKGIVFQKDIHQIQWAYHTVCIKACLSDTSTVVFHTSSTLLLEMLLLHSRNPVNYHHPPFQMTALPGKNSHLFFKQM